MVGGAHAKRVSNALDALRRAKTPADRLDAVRRVREAAEKLEAANLEAARDDGMTWAEIGKLYGLTKQGAQQRFRQGRSK
jgi:hypothetical protein